MRKWPKHKCASGNVVEMQVIKARRRKIGENGHLLHKEVPEHAKAIWRDEPSRADLREFQEQERGMLLAAAGGRFVFY